MVKAFIATEDSRFYELTALTRWGSSVRQAWRCSPVRVTRGEYHYPAAGEKLLPQSERTLMRKIKEVFLAIRIEQC